MNTHLQTVASPLVWAVPVLSLAGFLFIWLSGQNQDLFLWLNQFGRNEVAGIIWANITVLGDTLVAIALLSLLARRRPDIIWALLIAAVFTTLWVHGLKPLLENPRPGAILPGDVIHIIGVTLHGNSFPSGHSATVFTFAGVICLQRAHPLLMTSVLLLAIIAAISRAVVGAHWPLDIVAGAFGGWLGAITGVVLYQYLAQRNNWGQQIPGQFFFNIGFVLIAISLFRYNNGYPESQTFQSAVAMICLITAIFNLWQLFKQSKAPVL